MKWMIEWRMNEWMNGTLISWLVRVTAAMWFFLFVVFHFKLKQTRNECVFNLKGKKTTKERAQDRELISFGSLFYFISIELKRNKTIRNEINQEPKIQPTFHYIWLRFSSFYLTFSSNITGFSFTFRTSLCSSWYILSVYIEWNEPLH